MKKRKQTIAAVFLPSLAALCAWAQYSIDWHTIDGGGGTSTNGQYEVSGTIGQPDAGSAPMTGGPFSLSGGFWAIYAVQTPGAPFLSIVISAPTDATISWNPDDPGWVLQETLDLTSSSWTNSPSGTTNPIVVPASVPEKFYRLFKP
ncbi:hypothetical protein PDESU_05325 [Pontiella desulfatans]|uniref:Uncharacterized protein n=1 Tax=Pontiella desulfatans TaxID=2750659 RepID=A0A6C2UBJ8_PONDE|nr:hypothetical protein [Pontiella desulfatans]VGO16734.1 hypothetical protein PDESU_05325 [Pontiella desulfatans]